VRSLAHGGRVAILVAAVAGGLGMRNMAHASDAAELLREGVSLRRQGKDEVALERFQRAYELDHSARALAQMGLAEHALGRWVPAYEHLTQALAATGDSWVSTNGAALRASRDEVSQHVGKLEVFGGSPGAEVRIDGVLRGQLPLEKPLVLPIGSVTIAISRPGFVPVQRVAIIRAQQMTGESFEALAPSTQSAPVDNAVAVAVAPPRPNEETAAEAPARPAPAAAPASDGGVSAARASAKWIAWGAAVAGLGVGILGYTQQSNAGSQFNGSCYVDEMGAVRVRQGVQSTVAQCSTLSGRVNTWFSTEGAGFVGAAALASVGVVLWLLEPQPAPTRTAWRACGPSAPGGGGVSVGCLWQF